MLVNIPSKESRPQTEGPLPDAAKQLEKVQDKTEP